jgi:hypothetical protein
MVDPNPNNAPSLIDTPEENADRLALIKTISRLERQAGELAKTIDDLHAVLDADPSESERAQETRDMVPLKCTAIEFSPETVRRWIVRGHVAGRKTGGRWAVDLASLNAWLRRRSSRAA